MLSKITLEYFRRHEDLTIDFVGGINILKAANEGGKSTLLEAINYALFGSKALRTPLDETVTWGMDVKKLKVTLHLQIGEDSLVFTRGKSGAEVVKNGSPFVTGQNEVSTFAATLLGADAGVASKLMFASQNGLRGALEEGPKALSVMIEDLSDMSVFDQILDAAAHKLVLGSPTVLEERLKGARATLAAATETLPVKPDDEDHHAKITALSNKSAESAAKMATLEANVKTTDAAWLSASTTYAKRGELESAVTQARAYLAKATALVAELKPSAETILTDSRDAYRAEIAAADQHQNRLKNFRLFRGLPVVGSQVFASFDEFSVKVQDADGKKTSLEKQLNATQRELAVTKARRINHDKCDKCGQDVTHLESVVKTNAEVDAAVTELTALETGLTEELALAREAHSQMTAIERAANAFNAALTKIDSTFIKIDPSVYPPTVAWIGDEPSTEAPNAEGARARLAAADELFKSVESAKAKLELATQQRDEAELKLDRAEQALENFVCPTAQDILTLSEAKEEAERALAVTQLEIQGAADEIKTLTAAHTSAVQIWAACQARIDDANNVIADCEKDLAALEFNNALVKKLRSLRPLIADKLWNTVLAGVSAMFSQMRGVPSIVTKGKDGFRVNDQAVESLSGSTLDVLGIALRCALLRTFIPHNPLLILDEPAQGCDQARTESMLGFLQTLSMGQTLLVTHETVSESVADNIIQL